MEEKRKKKKEFDTKEYEENTERTEHSDFVYACDFLGGTKAPANSKPKQAEGECEFSPGIKYYVSDNSTVNFCGSGVLQGKEEFEPDDTDPFVGRHSFYNCLGEHIEDYADMDSVHYIFYRMCNNPNKWCTEIIVDESVTSIENCAFYGIKGLKRLTIKGKNTDIGVFMSERVIICAPQDSAAHYYAQKNGNPFEELQI